MKFEKLNSNVSFTVDATILVSSQECFAAVRKLSWDMGGCHGSYRLSELARRRRHFRGILKQPLNWDGPSNAGFQGCRLWTETQAKASKTVMWNMSRLQRNWCPIKTHRWHKMCSGREAVINELLVFHSSQTCSSWNIVPLQCVMKVSSHPPPSPIRCPQGGRVCTVSTCLASRRWPSRSRWWTWSTLNSWSAVPVSSRWAGLDAAGHPWGSTSHSQSL